MKPTGKHDRYRGHLDDTKTNDKLNADRQPRDQKSEAGDDRHGQMSAIDPAVIIISTNKVDTVDGFIDTKLHTTIRQHRRARANSEHTPRLTTLNYVFKAHDF